MITASSRLAAPLVSAAAVVAMATLFVAGIGGCDRGSSVTRVHDRHGEHHHGDGAAQHGDDAGAIHARGGAADRASAHDRRDDRVVLTAEAADLAGIATATAGPARIVTTLRVYGRVLPNEDRLAHVIPRYPGIVKEVFKRLGDSVAEGETLAVIESNESLERYPVVSEIAGTVIKKHMSPGEFAERDDDVYIVADLSTVWVDLNVYRRDFARLALGQRVRLDAGEGIPPATGTIDYISPFGAESTQSMLARTVLPNTSGLWKPGLFVSGDVVVDDADVPVAVRSAAIQTLDGRSVVFVREGDAFAARPVDLGRRDGESIEVVAGVRAGERYVSENSFVLKADLGKGGAVHEH